MSPGCLPGPRIVSHAATPASTIAAPPTTRSSRLVGVLVFSCGTFMGPYTCLKVPSPFKGDPENSSRGYKSLTALWTWIVDPDGTPEGNCKMEDGQVVCQRAFRPLVTPYNPSQSRLVNMLRARGADRMPPDRPLPEADIRLIELWILDGAKKGGVSLPAVPAATAPNTNPPDGSAPPPVGAPDGGAIEAGASDAQGGGGS